MDEGKKESDDAYLFPILNIAVRKRKQTTSRPNKKNNAKKHCGYAGKNFISDIKIIISAAVEKIYR